MKTNILCIYITLLAVLFLPFFPAEAVEIKSYLVTEEQEFFGNPNLNTVYFYKTFQINYKSGKVVLSANPDGTGMAAVGEELNAYVTYPGSGSFTYKLKTCKRPHEKIPPLDITHLMHDAKYGPTHLTVRFIQRHCPDFYKQEGNYVAYMKIGPMYVVHFDDYEPAAEPFLDLPWDYAGKGLLFADAATNMSSYFDHEYPLLSANWFVQEPNSVNSDIVDFTGLKVNKPYSGHDGYDYAAPSHAFLNDSVLAAAPGVATYHNNCSACGNAIHIDHGNGYQTRYYHLQPDGLITNNPNQKVTVNNRQQIGKIGTTGRSSGAHIHFMLIQDKNNDGNFDDNIPDGIVDPYGWRGSGVDPWTQFTFTQNGVEKTGAKSNYLWSNSLKGYKKTLTSDGGNITNNRFTFVFPKDTTLYDLILSIKPIPYAEPSASLKPLGHVVEATADDGFGNFITQFRKLFTISMKLLVTDISRYKPESLSIYSSQNGIDWQKENTTINWGTNTATTQVNHLTQFAFMGEKLDSIAPVTALLINNTEPTLTEFFEPVTVSFLVSDEPLEDSLGVAYTLYAVNENELQQYTEPLIVDQFGEYNITYYSVDKDGNSEELQSVTFTISEPVTPTPTLEPTPTPTPLPTATITPILTPTNIPQPPIPTKPVTSVIIKNILNDVVTNIKTVLTQKQPIIKSITQSILKVITKLF